MIVNKDRIGRRLQQLSQFGKNANGGIDRNFGSTADLEAREYLSRLWESELGESVKIDPAANMWVTVPGSETLPAIVLGSHHDTVMNGGMYDGALGIILATEVLQVAKENNYKLRHPLSLVSFTAEEPNPFHLSTFGSRVATGKLGKTAVGQVTDEITGMSLAEALAKAGGSLAELDQAKLTGEDIGAFIECHIEQGKRLESQQLSLAVVSHITGIYREKIQIMGDANHAGTTIMSDRHDALLAAAEFCLAFETAVKAIGRDDVVGTIGRFEVFPNAVNIIPGQISLIMEVRTPDEQFTRAILDILTQQAAGIEAKRGITICRDILLDQAAVAMDEKIMTTLARASETIAEPYVELASMAGHDATHLAGVARAGMLFVRSVAGKSHCPEEYSDIEDIVKAAEVLLEAVVILDKELD